MINFLLSDKPLSQVVLGVIVSAIIGPIIAWLIIEASSYRLSAEKAKLKPEKEKQGQVVVLTDKQIDRIIEAIRNQ